MQSECKTLYDENFRKKFRFSDSIPKGQAIKEIIFDGTSPKCVIVFFRRMKDKLQTGRKIFADHASNKGLV